MSPIPSPSQRPSSSSSTAVQQPQPHTSILPYTIPLSFVTGLVMGALTGSRTTALRFRAENAHRQPTLTRDWYLYHKTKNYVVALGGIKEGIRTAPKVAAAPTGFVIAKTSVKSLLDDAGGDALAGVVAGGATAGAWAAWNRMSVVQAARTARAGLLVGLGVGMLEDLVAVGSSGERRGWVDGLARRWRRLRGEGEMEKIS